MEVNSKCITVFTVLSLALLLIDCVNGYDHLPGSEISKGNITTSKPLKPLKGGIRVDRFKEKNVKGMICPLCLFAVESIEDKLKNNQTKEEIKNLLESICRYLPGDAGEECNSFIVEYFDDLMDMLVADFTPVEICTFFKLCKDPELRGKNIGFSNQVENFKPSK